MRKTNVVTISDVGRDYGKRFLITEMPAYQAEKWAQRALLALAHSEIDLGTAIMQGGIAGLAVAGLQAMQRLTFDEAEPLLDEMLGCVKMMPDPKNMALTRDLVLNTPETPEMPAGTGDDVQEVQTFWRLREAVFDLHTGFFTRGTPSKSTLDKTTTSPVSSSGKTSRARSAA